MTAPSRSPDIRWRRARLVEYGFAEALADRLAVERADVHALLSLVDRGCPPPLAARILEPLDERHPESA